MKILSYNPSHDGAFAYVEDGRLVFSIEAEKNSNFRHSRLSIDDTFNAFSELLDAPDVLCKGGWWPGDAPRDGEETAGYRSTDQSEIIVGKKVRLRRRPPCVDLANDADGALLTGLRARS